MKYALRVFPTTMHCTAELSWPDRCRGSQWAETAISSPAVDASGPLAPPGLVHTAKLVSICRVGSTVHLPACLPHINSDRNIFLLNKAGATNKIVKKGKRTSKFLFLEIFLNGRIFSLRDMEIEFSRIYPVACSLI